VKYGSLARKSASFEEDFDRNEGPQDVEGIQNDDERRKGLNSTTLSISNLQHKNS